MGGVPGSWSGQIGHRSSAWGSACGGQTWPLAARVCWPLYICTAPLSLLAPAQRGQWGQWVWARSWLRVGKLHEQDICAGGAAARCQVCPERFKVQIFVKSPFLPFDYDFGSVSNRRVLEDVYLHLRSPADTCDVCASVSVSLEGEWPCTSPKRGDRHNEEFIMAPSPPPGPGPEPVPIPDVPGAVLQLLVCRALLTKTFLFFIFDGKTTTLRP